MKLLPCAALLATLAIASFAPAADATLDVPACVGYEDCYEKTHDGFALFCVKDPRSGRWMCGECEACGNPIILP